MEESWSVAALEHTPSAWLSEVVLAALSWQGTEVPSGWRSWVHTVWLDEDLIPVGLEVVAVQSEVKETVFLLARTSAPSNETVAKALLEGTPDGAEALVVLTPAYLAEMPALKFPLIVPARGAFPNDPPGPLTPPPYGRQSVLIGTGCTPDASAVMLARPIATALTMSDGGVVPQMALAPTGVDLLGPGGVLTLEPYELPLPWVRLALAGSSKVEAEQVPAGPDLPLLSLWLGRVLDVVEDSDERWWDALSLLPLWEHKYDSWEAVQLDQQTERNVGNIVDRRLALRMDPNLFGTVMLSEVPSPKVLSSQLAAKLSRRRRKEINKVLAVHPKFNRWLTKSSPKVESSPWR